MALPLEKQRRQEETLKAKGYAKCEECDGKGQTPRRWGYQECPSCKGQGWIKPDDSNSE